MLVAVCERFVFSKVIGAVVTEPTDNSNVPVTLAYVLALYAPEFTRFSICATVLGS